MSAAEGRGGGWTDEPGYGEEGRRRLKAPRSRASQQAPCEAEGRGGAWTEERGTRAEGRRPRGGAPEPGGPALCLADVCVTCSDTAVAVRVVGLLDDDLAIVDTGSGQEEVSVALVTAGIGDTILVHAKEAIAVVPR